MELNEVPQSAARFENPLTIVLALVSGVFAAGCLLALSFAAFFPDQLWLLYGAERVLAHAPIYNTEVMESNPPFILWLNTLPVMLGHVVHRSSGFGLRVCILLLTVGILLWCVVLLRQFLTSKRVLLPWAMTAALLGATYFLTMARDAGQREHLMALFLLPYLFCTGLRLRGEHRHQLEALLAGLSAAVAVCCKPQHVIVVVGIELVVIGYHKSVRQMLRPEFFGVALGGVAYLAAVELFAPRYLHEVVPLLTQTYWAFGGIPFLTMVLQKRSLLLLGITLLCAGLAWVWRERMQAFGLLVMLLTAACCSLDAYWLQGTGFNYQLIPLSIFLPLAVTMLAADLMTSPLGKVRHETVAPLPGSGAVWPPEPIPLVDPWVSAALAFVVCVGLVAGMHGRFERRAVAKSMAAFDPQTQAILAAYPAGTPVYFMSLDLGMFTPVVDHNFVWGSRFPHLWMLPAIVRNEAHQPHLHKVLTAQQMADLNAKQDAYLVEDFEHWHPQLVGVERCYDATQETCEGMNGIHVNLLEWFSRDARFRQEWSHYRFVQSAGRYDFYALQP